MEIKILYRRYNTIKQQEMNEEIRDKEVRLLGPEGEQLGIVSIEEARDIAEKANMDLVKIAPGAKPPVCRVMDFGKHKYELAKRDKDARKKQKTQQV